MIKLLFVERNFDSEFVHFIELFFNFKSGDERADCGCKVRAKLATEAGHWPWCSGRLLG